MPTPLVPHRRQPPVERWRREPVACSLSSAAVLERASDWAALLDGAARELIPDGVQLTLPVSQAGAVAGLAAAEQQCCPFFDFELHLDGDSLILKARAPADAAALLTALFG